MGSQLLSSSLPLISYAHPNADRPCTASVGRKALKDVVLSDGTLIPAGTLVAANSYRMHYDDAYYPNADEFDPFRFARMREIEGEGTKHQFVNTSNNYVPFGVGRHAW